MERLWLGRCDPHARAQLARDMTTCNEPVLILWAWIGEDLNLVPILREEDQGSIPDGA